MSHTLLKRSLLATLVSLCWVASAQAELISYHFTTQISSINSSVAGIPAALNGVAVGDAVTGTLSFDSSTLPGTNPISTSPYSTASFFVLNGGSLSLQVDGMAVGVKQSPLIAFVWNDASALSGQDGLVFNGLGSGMTFQLGNLNLPTNTFTRPALPSSSSLPVSALYLYGDQQARWLTTDAFIATQAVPEPETYALLLSGLGALTWLQRRRGSGHSRGLAAMWSCAARARVGVNH